MRWAARRNAASVSAEQDAAALAISSGATRIVSGVKVRRSKRCVYWITAASPRAFTSARISATTASTSASASRLAASSAANLSAKSVAVVSSLCGIGGLAETLDPIADLLRARLERGAVDDEARGDVGDMLDLDEPVGFQGRAGLDEIDDLPAQADARRELHGAVELDALRLHASCREMPARDLGIFGGDAHMAPPRGIIAAGILGGRGDHEAAMPDLEVERRVDLGVLELHQHIVAGDAKMGGAEGDESRHVEIPDADHVEAGKIGAEAKLTRLGIVEGAFDLDARATHQRDHLAEDTPLGQRQNQLLVTAHLRSPEPRRAPRPAFLTETAARSESGSHATLRRFPLDDAAATVCARARRGRRGDTGSARLPAECWRHRRNRGVERPDPRGSPAAPGDDRRRADESRGGAPRRPRRRGSRSTAARPGDKPCRSPPRAHPGAPPR